jgi:hypothetical protein
MMGLVTWLAARTRHRVAALTMTPGALGRTAWDDLPWERRQRYRDRLHLYNWLFALLALALVVGGARETWHVMQQLRTTIIPPRIVRHTARLTPEGRLLWEATFNGIASVAVTDTGYVLVRQQQGTLTGLWVISRAGEPVWHLAGRPGDALPPAAIGVTDGTTVLLLGGEEPAYLAVSTGEAVAGVKPESSSLSSPSTVASSAGAYVVTVNNRPGGSTGMARVCLYWLTEPDPILPQ